MITATEWNDKHPAGTMVIRKKPNPPGTPSVIQPMCLRTVTTGKAFHLSSGKAVVRLEGVDGYVPLAEIEVVQQAEEGVF